jgi:hypothetical protein
MPVQERPRPPPAGADAFHPRRDSIPERVEALPSTQRI